MTNCWLSNGDLEKYLRPITLFGDNFDSYLNDDWEQEDCDLKPPSDLKKTNFFSNLKQGEI